ncbi:MAG: hypothetical protein IPK39_11920 [Sulfuritalea sp.]|nr:hypothetical protein [Sulfuritalea sp.]
MSTNPPSRQALNLLVVADADAALVALALALEDAEAACHFHRVASADSLCSPLRPGMGPGAASAS